jgi:hypothetical protein
VTSRPRRSRGRRLAALSAALAFGGSVVVGDAAAPSAGAAATVVEAPQAGVTRAPQVDAGTTIVVPRDAPTIQAAVDRAAPGTLVLVDPGVYRESVVVTRPDLVIRGVDRNRTVLDGQFRRGDGIDVRADGVAVENLTALDYVGNGFFWQGVDGYRGSYLTAVRNGVYGIYALASRHGQFDHSYASGSADAGFYVGACDPCDAVVSDVVAENNAVGFSGTNAGGDVSVIDSSWRYNGVGIVPNSLDDEPASPQGGMLIAGNLVVRNQGSGAPRSDEFSALNGTGIALVGVVEDVVAKNRIADQARAGIVVAPNPGIESEYRPALRNRVEANVVQRSGTADLVLVATADQGNCFEQNRFRTSAPVDLERAAPCAGPATEAVGVGAISASRLFARAGNLARVSYQRTPVPPRQPNLPAAVTAPPQPATAEPTIVVDLATLAVPAAPTRRRGTRRRPGSASPSRRFGGDQRPPTAGVNRARYEVSDAYAPVASRMPSVTRSTPATRSIVGPMRWSRAAIPGNDASPSAASRNGTPMPKA